MPEGTRVVDTRVLAVPCKHLGIRCVSTTSGHLHLCFLLESSQEALALSEEKKMPTLNKDPTGKISKTVAPPSVFLVEKHLSVSS